MHFFNKSINGRYILDFENRKQKRISSASFSSSIDIDVDFYQGKINQNNFSIKRMY